jgi:hypothetical protein
MLCPKRFGVIWSFYFFSLPIYIPLICLPQLHSTMWTNHAGVYVNYSMRPARSLRTMCAGSVCGLSAVCVQCVPTVYADCLQSAYNVCRQCMRTVRSLRKICAGSLCGLSAVCVQCVPAMYADCPQSAYNVCWQCMRTVRSLRTMCAGSVRGLSAVCV